MGDICSEIGLPKKQSCILRASVVIQDAKLGGFLSACCGFGCFEGIGPLCLFFQRAFSFREPFLYLVWFMSRQCLKKPAIFQGRELEKGEQ
jgi:hypothetical protein